MSEATVWDELPFEVLVYICRYLSAEDIGRIASVYSRWAQVAENQRVWRGKSYLYLSEGGQRLTNALLVARALPVLKRVSVHRGEAFKAYLSGESADFEVPNLRDAGVRSVISPLVTQNLSLEFCLLKVMPFSCLTVQPHCLEQLQVQHSPGSPQFGTRDKLRALIRTLSQVPLTNLRSIAIICPPYTVQSPTISGNVMDISAPLLMCPALEQLSIHASSFLSWNPDRMYSKLQSLELSGCVIDEISFLDLCPKLRSLSLEYCKPLSRRELSRKSELRSVVLRHLPVDMEVLNELCLACPELESIAICNCEHITHTLPLRHCPRLTSVNVESTEFYAEKQDSSTHEVRLNSLWGFRSMNVKRVALPSMVGLPPQLRCLRLHSQDVTTDVMTEIVNSLPHLETLAVNNCDIESLHFLRPLASLTELSLTLKYPSTFQHLEGLIGLRRLQKLCLHYGGPKIDVRWLSEALLHMPQLEVLDVQIVRCVSELSFLQHCRRLRSLTLVGCFSSAIVEVEELSLFNNLENLDMLENLIVHNFNVHILDGILSKMPQLKDLYMNYSDIKCDFGFIWHCPHLTSLRVSFSNTEIWSFEALRCLEQLRTLTLVLLPEEQLSSLRTLRTLTMTVLPEKQLASLRALTLIEEQLSSLIEVVKEMPQLEYLGLEEGGPNFLKSWKFHRMLSLLGSRTQN